MIRIGLTAESRRELMELRQRTRPDVIARSTFLVLGRQASLIAAQTSKRIQLGYAFQGPTRYGLRRRSGALARSIVGVADRVHGKLAMRVGILRGPALAYAGVQEYGTQGKNPASPYPTIKPKRARALAMPVGKGLTPAGVARYKSPRDYPKPLDFFPARGKRNVIGWLYEAESMKRAQRIVERNGVATTTVDFGKLVIVYALLRKVDIRPHYFLRDTFNELLPNASAAIALHFKRLIAGLPLGPMPGEAAA